jgi:hypothetical protein
MPDQNIMVIFSNIIAVIGTLSGVIIGVILTNRYSLKLEKRKKHNQTIEEIYDQLIKIHLKVRDFARKQIAIDIEETYNNIVDYEARINVLTLYMPIIKEKYDDHITKMDALALARWNYSESNPTAGFKKGQSDDDNDGEKLDQAYNNYFDSYKSLREALQKMIK